MSETPIQKIINTGKEMNNKLGQKISLLVQNNSNFNQQLTDRLKRIIDSIATFKSTNLQGLTETKNRLDAVSKELETTKETLQQTQNELKRVQNELAVVQNQLQTTTDAKNTLEQRVKELEERIRQMELEYGNKINAVRDEMSKKFTEENNARQQEHEVAVSRLNNEKIELQKGIEDAKRAQTEAINNLETLKREHEGLIINLGTVNEILAGQLNLIETINTEQPNIDQYSTLLEGIQNGLSGLIGEINQAVSNNSSTPLYDRFMRLSDKQKEQIYNTIDADYTRAIIEAMKSPTPTNKQNIQNILSRRYKGDLLRGGKRRSKTIKKRHRRTFKKMRGGYVYSISKELDKASSVVSTSSGSKSKSKSKSQKNKTRSKLMK